MTTLIKTKDKIRTHKPIYFTPLILFVVLSTLLSGLFRPPVTNFLTGIDLSFIERFALVVVCIGWGPAIAAFIISKASHKNIKFNMVGTWKTGAILSIFAVPALMAVIGVENNEKVNPHLFGLILGALLILYTIGEEIGWRGYLNNSLKSLTLVLRSIVIGTVWWFWHLSFLKKSTESGLYLAGTFSSHLFYWGILVGISVLFLSIVDRNKSILQVAAFHATGNIAFFAGSFTFISNDKRYFIATCVLLSLLVIHGLWQKNKAIENKAV
ncbi:CPBP family intramembrane metalloprotease [Alteromonas sediminis]|uniref:CPBP family intramembrane metalloprotease n=1 Tax=Alteromonas sediminis TaxID=2259342 RepID=A0A3N5YD45_9ALTE|nr:CPBP family glutamic-type intramembrane protease [Alteromonas sediminis]RPJ67385.1 CPBP family intramembrane metalloprotease [Alteromonas sediminis]